MNTFNETGIETNYAYRRVMYVLVVACFPFVLAGLLTQVVFLSGAVERGDGITHQSKHAYFEFPASGDLVTDQFDVSGRVEFIPAGEVVYLVERVGSRFWPKLRIGSEPTDFQRKHETTPGAGYKYTIELLSMNTAAESHINRWFDRAKETGKYPGIKITEGVTVLARARVVHQWVPWKTCQLRDEWIG